MDRADSALWAAALVALFVTSTWADVQFINSVSSVMYPTWSAVAAGLFVAKVLFVAVGAVAYRALPRPWAAVIPFGLLWVGIALTAIPLPEVYAI